MARLDTPGLSPATGGFRGSTFDPSSPGHLPSTYTALLVLGILRAPLDRLDIPNLRSFLHACRAGDAFSPLPNPPLFDFQADVRMTYCAAVVADMINEALPGAERFLESCATWEGGYAAKPGMIEAQGGTTYCAVAALTLLGRPVDMQVLRWASQRQIGGFQGRPGKLQDVCYSFWIGAALQILGQPIVDAAADRAFLLSSQSPIGGFGKDPDDMPDPYHSYLALAALALSDPELTPLDPLWNSTKTTAAWLKDEFTRCIQR